VRQPGETRLGKIIRKIILDPDYKEISPLSEMLLYMVSHNQLIQEVIIPYLKKDYIILCDRFLDSTIAYQGYGLKVDLDLIKKLANFVSEGISPDLTILLDLPVEQGLRRLKRNPDRIEKRKILFHKRLRRGYLKLAKMYPERIKVVAVDKDITSTQKKIRKLILEKLCLLGK